RAMSPRRRLAEHAGCTGRTEGLRIDRVARDIAGLLELTRAAFDQCAVTPSAADLVRASEAIVKSKPPAHATNEMAEEVLQLAVRLWQSEPAGCQRGTSDQATLDLIMKKVTS
ncbi:MAG: hypothetical protein KGM96_01020, partial [Acidobacteriota bacterium]|nr:hypothetical protein [Acidobacteriota bacterium]